MIQPGVKQEILQLASVEKRLKKVKQLLDVEMEICSLEEKINSEVRVNMEKSREIIISGRKLKRYIINWGTQDHLMKRLTVTGLN